MKKLLIPLVCLLFVSTAKADETAEVAAVLDALHEAAAHARTEAYFHLFSEDAVYIGTDVAEFWTLQEFKSYVLPYFSKGRGWTYIPRSREIDLSSSGDIAWFHEILDSESYGTTRGTGVLVRDGEKGWLIAQYPLTFPVPNDLAGEITDRIKAFEAGLD